MSFFVAVVAALALGAACAAVVLRGRVTARQALAAGVALLFGAFWIYDGNVVPEQVTVLHEGGTRRTVDAIFGRDEHVGRLWADLASSALAARFTLPIEAVVQVNLLLALVSAAGLAAIAWAATGRVLAAPFALLVLSESRGFWNAAHSETPAPAVWLAFVTAAPAWRILDEARARPPTHHLLALLSLVASGGLAVGVREEFALHGGVFVSLALATFLAGAAPVDAAFARARAATVALLHAPWPARLGVLAAASVAVEWSDRLGAPFRVRLVIAAAMPTPIPLFGTASTASVTPLPVVALAVVGLFALVRGGAARAGLALATASLLGVHVIASHGVGWEMFRYGAHDAMAVWFAAVAGWCALERFAAERAWHPSWRSSIALVGAVLVLSPNRYEPGTPEWWDADARARRGESRRLADQARQREARLLLRAMHDEPRCLFVARMRRWGERRGDWSLVTFGVGRPLTVITDPHVTVGDLRASAGRCLRYVRTMDCNLRQAPRCEDDLRGVTALRVVRERLASYSDPEEYGEHTPEVFYGVWRVGR